MIQHVILSTSRLEPTVRRFRNRSAVNSWNPSFTVEEWLLNLLTAPAGLTYSVYGLTLELQQPTDAEPIQFEETHDHPVTDPVTGATWRGYTLTRVR